MSEGSLRGKTVWITGASAGIGRALALELGSRGANVAVSARRADRLAALVQDIEKGGSRALAVECDVTKEEAVQAAVGAVVAHFGQLDIAVANAGFSIVGKIANLTADEWRRQLDTNVVGLAVSARHAIPELLKTEGRIVLVGSVASMLVAPNSGAYAASKYAVRAIGQTLSVELHGSGVTCTTIHPGFVESEIAQVDNEGQFDAERPDKRPKRFMWPTDRAAKVMANAIEARKREYVFTGHGKIGAWVGRHWPGLIHVAMTRRGGWRE